MIHKFVANDNKGNVNILEVTSTGTKLGKLAPPENPGDAVTKEYVTGVSEIYIGYDGSNTCSVCTSSRFSNMLDDDTDVDNHLYDVLVDALENNKRIIAHLFVWDSDEMEWVPFYSGADTVMLCHISSLLAVSSVETIILNTDFIVDPVDSVRLIRVVAHVDSDEGACITGDIESVNKANNKFTVTLTPTAQDFSGTMDMTVAEINAAYEAGQEIVFRTMVSETTYMDVDCTARWFNGSTYPSFNGFILNGDDNVLLFAFTGTTDDGTKQTYFTKIYPLIPAS